MDNNTMEYRIRLEKQNKSNDQVRDLILDNCRASQISGLTDEFINLESLSLINVGLVTLKGFPKLPNLLKLELSDNRLTAGLNLLHGSPKLQSLNMSGNRIKDFEVLEPLKEFHDLTNLDLYNCEVTKIDDYRKKVFELVPNLLSLDGYDRNDKEVNEDTSDDEPSESDNHISRDDIDSDEEGLDEEEGGSSDFDEELGDDNDEEDFDEDLDAEDDQDSESESEAVATSGPSRPENGHDDDGEDEEEDEEYDEEDGNDLKKLENDILDEDSDDFEYAPTKEPSARDFEIDSEDDADKDAECTISNDRGLKRKYEDEGGDEED